VLRIAISHLDPSLCCQMRIGALRLVNCPGLFPVLNLAVGGSGGGDPASGSYPAEMLIDWVRVF
jgi:hypothetical protein